jgi:hypothetical protein
LLADYQSSDSEQDDNTGGNGEDDVDGSDSDAELAKPGSQTSGGQDGSSGAQAEPSGAQAGPSGNGGMPDMGRLSIPPPSTPQNTNARGTSVPVGGSFAERSAADGSAQASAEPSPSASRSRLAVGESPKARTGRSPARSSVSASQCSLTI